MCMSAKKTRMGICTVDQAFNFCGSMTDDSFAEAGDHISVKCRQASRPQKNALKPTSICLGSNKPFLLYHGLS